jgi:steroid 5-alpha reductase family enzyme
MLGVRLRDTSIADVLWGLGFVLLAWVYCVLSPAVDAEIVVQVASIHDEGHTD